MDNINILEISVDEINENYECFICMENIANIITVCNHKYCKKCIKRIQKCALCRKPFKLKKIDELNYIKNSNFFGFNIKFYGFNIKFYDSNFFKQKKTCLDGFYDFVFNLNNLKIAINTKKNKNNIVNLLIFIDDTILTEVLVIYENSLENVINSNIKWYNSLAFKSNKNLKRTIITRENCKEYIFECKYCKTYIIENAITLI